MAVVGDGRSGDPLHERDYKRDVYEGEVAKVDMVSELVRRVDGVVDGLRSLVGVARICLILNLSIKQHINKLFIDRN